jgi:hypothetical protein
MPVKTSDFMADAVCGLICAAPLSTQRKGMRKIFA